MTLIARAAGRVARTKLYWRWFTNYRRTRDYRNGADLRQPRTEDVRELLRDGTITRQAEEIFSAASLQFLETIQAEVAARAAREEVSAALQANEHTKKGFKLSLVPPEFDFDSPYLRLALDPGLLAVVNAYMGMRSALRAIEAWIDVPTPDEAKETQLWHRDGDDLLNVKVFIYLNDVDETTGPFCYARRTHPNGGKFGRLLVKSRIPGRVTDEEMLEALPAELIRMCTGPARSITLADTVGYHKGLKPTLKRRLLVMFQYTSGCPKYPVEFKLTGTPDLTGLSADQRFALIHA
jgi:hypothetical protein